MEDINLRKRDFWNGRLWGLINRMLNDITMYRLVLYGLFVLAIFAIGFGFAKIISYSGVSLLESVILLLLVCQVSNWILAKLFKAPTNTESALITALILFFILAPIMQIADVWGLMLAGIIAMLSKYILAIGKKHIFNPAAFAAFAMGFINGSAIWWVANLSMLPLVLIIGFLIVKKMRRFKIFFIFLIVALVTIFVSDIIRGYGNIGLLWQDLVSWPIFFFGAVMLTEPITTPSRNKFRIIFAILVGILFGIPFSFGPVFSTPELSLLIGNIFSIFVNIKRRLILSLKEKREIAQNTYEFIFTSEKKVNYIPGQYIECTLPHDQVDDRGDRRYFTLASSPTESEIKLGIKFANNPSSFKKSLLKMKSGDLLYAGQLAGDFILSKNLAEKTVFIAGGIGITPFRSMMQYVLDKNEPRSIILLYTSKTELELAYRDVFERAAEELHVNTIYVLTDINEVPVDWKGEKGFVTKEMISQEIPDYKERFFYLSGPTAMVNNYKKLLLQMGVHRKKIMTDYFPGFA